MNNTHSYRILLTSDMHCTDLMTWYGVSDAARLQHWVDCILAEHKKQPFDLILIPGDISLDYHAEKTPYDKGHSTGLIFMQQFLSQLPADVPRFILAGNHEQFTHEDWRALVGNERQGALSVGKYTFLMMDNFAEDLGPVYDSSDKYTQMDVGFIREQLAAAPDHEFYLVSHYFSMDKESEEFRTLVATEPRIRGLFMGHTHLNTVIPLGEDYAGKVIAQTGNFSYTCGDLHRDFWGFRDLVIAPDGSTVSSYIIPESTIMVGGTPLTIEAKVTDVVNM
ncbi:MAG: metallophosphoesterase [Clostridia bacterium]|nr:metallophosphoesterase [Clostridia bacterium]